MKFTYGATPLILGILSYVGLRVISHSVRLLKNYLISIIVVIIAMILSCGAMDKLPLNETVSMLIFFIFGFGLAGYDIYKLVKSRKLN